MRPWPDDKPLVVTQGLTKVFKDFWMRPRVRAVDDVDLEIGPHEVFGLLGPNGSGKSTTIKIILGLLHRTSGRVAVFGKSPANVNMKQRVGYLPEESYLYPFLTARETLAYYAKLFELDRRVRERRIDDLLEMVGLTAVQHRQMHEYSKGMQRRIGLAQALINDPDLLILDEPTSGLDPIGARQVKDLIMDLGRRGKTVLLSSHLLADVEECVDRAVILYGGRIRAQGTIEELLTESSHSLIETDALSEETLVEVQRVLATHGGARVHSVEKPKKRLEELFMDIVERAQDERAATSGAVAGGRTAAFLVADGGVDKPLEGEQLLQTLTGDGAAESESALAAEHDANAANTPDAAQTGATERDELLAVLTESDDAPVAASRKAEESADGSDKGREKASTAVDQSMLESLVATDRSNESKDEPDAAEDAR